ncbi:Hsp20/alpha crystallin family protein [Denitromonas sp.]|uniref:Hsp20/alpha crystallin family protein n=1 Tax=Denitromonas sp. TaxID=2734609 RepID=UPI002B003CA9|nr:Hsp20/alpha crystallin family protein [Denitromonas sp.]
MSNITRHDPFEDFFRGFFVRPVEYGGGTAEAPQMRVDVKESPEGYAVHAELPGVTKEDIHVHIDGPVVSITAERKQQSEQKDGERVLRTERYYGKVSRSFQLGQDVDESRAAAKFVDGVLELTLPKKAAVQAKRLTID